MCLRSPRSSAKPFLRSAGALRKDGWQLGVILGVGVLVVFLFIFLARYRVGSPRDVLGAEWEVAFTAPSTRELPRSAEKNVDQRLVHLIDDASQTLDVAVYDIDLSDVAHAMSRAAQRGVTVRMVTDSSTLQSQNPKVLGAFEVVRDAQIPVVADERPSIMHHKFTVGDGEWVQTGSWNYTEDDTWRLDNNLAVFHSRELAQRYTDEFERMFVARRFGLAKGKDTPGPPIQAGALTIQPYFSPRQGVAARVVDRVKQAQRSVHFLAFSFTHDAIGRSMRERAQAGVELKGVFENTGSNTPFSEYAPMRAAGLEVYRDANPSFMHHKVITIDGRVTLFGSFNFSESADRDNDENLLVVEDATFTSAFEQEFRRVLELAQGRAALLPWRAGGLPLTMGATSETPRWRWVLEG